MRALTLQKIKEPLAIEDYPDLQPEPGEAVVKLRCAALNRRDYWITQGMYPGINPPVVLGSDGAGVVARCGSDIDPSWLDREVVINPGLDWGPNPAAQAAEFTILGLPKNGTFATEVVVPVEQLHAKPEHLSWEEAAAIPLAGVTAYRALFSQGQLKPGETVLITGIGGGVATFALQFALACQASVWVTSSSEQKIQKAVDLGAAGGFNYRSDGWSKALVQQAGEPNLIIDSAGGAGYSQLLNVASPGARIVNYGATAGPPEKLDMFKLFWKQLRLQGSTMGSPDDFIQMLELLNQHQIKPVVDQVLPFEQGNAAIESMKSSPQFGKLVLNID